MERKFATCHAQGVVSDWFFERINADDSFEKTVMQTKDQIANTLTKVAFSTPQSKHLCACLM